MFNRAEDGIITLSIGVYDALATFSTAVGVTAESMHFFGVIWQLHVCSHANV